MPVEVIKIVGCCTVKCTGFRDAGDGWTPNKEGTPIDVVAMATEKGGVMVACPLLAKNPEDARISWCRQSFDKDGKPERCAYGG